MNACTACKHGKRKCSKSRPSCAHCLRLHKTCVYTEDTVQTHYVVERGTMQARHGVGSFSQASMTDLGPGTLCSQDGQNLGFWQVADVGDVQKRGFVAGPGPLTVVQNAFVDPFFKPPCRLSEQGREAADHLFRGSFHPLEATRNCGLLNRIRGTAAFFQLLAFSSWHLALLRNDRHRDDRHDVFSLQYAARASRELQKQICDPRTCTTVELIMAVFVFASSSAQMRDPETARVHINGARRMIEYQTNLRSFESDTWAMAILFWVETVACSFADVPARFPVPTELLSEYKRSNKQISQWIETNVVDPTVSPVFSHPAAVRAINAIREVQVVIQSEAYKRDVSNDTHFASNHILPIFHDLLALLDHDRSFLQEGFRLAAMLFLHELQAIYWGRIPPLLFLDKLHRLISSSDLNWSSPDPTLLWIIAIALTSNIDTNQEARFIRRFKLLVKANRITAFDNVMERLVQISWDYDFLRARTEKLRGYFMENC